ncbi:MAG: DUF4091 domain-containing protein [Candidatus Hydrogenedentes bacterium]|nr:DUF4091 domain-containing protein [Candidatus Hydrogenedentota bacterium]
MFSALLFSLLAAASTEVWTTPTLSPPWDADRGGVDVSQEARLYAAQGEFESFLLFVRAGRKGVKGLALECEAGSALPPPTFYEAGPAYALKPSSRMIAPGAAWPDALAPVAPRDLASAETAVFWVCFEVPRGARPGVHETTVRVMSGKRRVRTVPVRVEVFAFALPEVPSLRVYATLDRGAMRRIYGLDEIDLEGWKPVYDALAPLRISYSVWDGSAELVRIDATGRAETGAWKEHLAYAVNAARMAAIDAGASGRLALLVPPPPPGEPQDPLQFLLHDMGNWLAERGWLERAFIETVIPAQRDQWPGALATLHRIWRADKRFNRLIATPLHPHWERYAEIWTAPYLAYEPEYAQRLRTGVSLVEGPAPQVRARASSCGASAEGAPTLAQDACDGSLVSAWRPERAAGSRDTAWIEFGFEAPLPLRSLRVVWAAERAPEGLAVETSYNGNAYAPSTAAWQHRSLWGTCPRVESMASLAYEKEVLGARVAFRCDGNAPPAIAEVSFNPTEGQDTRPPDAPRVATWLQIRNDAFPSLALDAHPAEARLVAWVCHSRGLEGCHAGHLNHWPGEWLPGMPVIRMDEAARQMLVYPGAAGCTPSARAMRLRDGIEDFEYMKALEDAVLQGRASVEEARRVLPPILFGPQPMPEELTELTRRMMEIRVAVGRALSALPGREN